MIAVPNYISPQEYHAIERQAMDRTHRIGQDKPVFVHRLVAADTVEEKILLVSLSGFRGFHRSQQSLNVYWIFDIFVWIIYYILYE